MSSGLRLLHTADWHLGKRLEQFSRADEQEAILGEFCEIADAHDVHFVLIAGDVFDAFNPPTQSISLFYRTLKRLSNDGNRAVMVIAGNHDAPERISAPGHLAAINGIILVGTPNETPIAFETEAGVKVTILAPGVVRATLPGVPFPVTVVLTPYANGQRLRKILDPDSETESLEAVLQNAWSHQVGEHRVADGVMILMTHLFVTGDGSSRMESGETEDERSITIVGGADAISVRAVPDGVDYVALGHIHRGAQIATFPCPTLYPGSPLSYSFGDTSEKRVVIVTLLPHTPAHIEWVPLRTGRRLVRVEGLGIDHALTQLAEVQMSWVELTIRTDTYVTPLDLARLHDAHPRIVSVIPIVTEAKSESSHKPAPALNQPIDVLFNDYFSLRFQGVLPSDELLAVFREVVAHQVDE